MASFRMYYTCIAVAVIAWLCLLQQSNANTRVRVEKATARSMAKSKIKTMKRNPALMHELGQVMGPKSFDVPEGYDKMARPYKNGRAVNVTIGITIKRIADVNDKEGSVVFDVLFLTQWMDPRLKNIAFKRILPKDVWTPGLFVSNEGKEPDWFSSDMVLNKDGSILYERRVLVTVEHTFELTDFPFDHHDVPININAFGYDANDVMLRADHTRDSNVGKLRDSTWDLQGFTLEAKVEQTLLSPRDSIIVGTLHVKRKTTMILTTILMPLVLIVLFTFLAFFVWEKDFGSRITVTSIGFLTVMAFMFVVNDQLPRIAYLTWMHYYMSLCFLMTFIVNVHVSFVHFLNPVGETKLEKKKRIQGGEDHRHDVRGRDGKAIEEGTEPLISKEEKKRNQLREDLLEAFHATDTETDANLNATEMVKVSAAAGKPIDIPTAKKWIEKAKVFNEQKHMSFEIFARLMEEKLERDERYSLKSLSKKFNALEKLGYTKDKVSILDKSCRFWLPAIFLIVTVVMFVIEIQNINYKWEPKSSGIVKHIVKNVTGF
eukprot:g4181.t1